MSWSHNICSDGEIRQEFEAQLDELRRENEARARIEEEQVSMLKKFVLVDPSRLECLSREY